MSNKCKKIIKYVVIAFIFILVLGYCGNIIASNDNVKIPNIINDATVTVKCSAYNMRQDEKYKNI